MSESIELLELSPELIANLRTAGIHSISDLETELKDERSFQTKVINCGRKTIPKLRVAINKYKKGLSPTPASNSTPTPAPTSTPAPPTPAPAPKAPMLSEGTRDRRSARAILMVLVATFVVGACIQFFGGRFGPDATITMICLLSMISAIVLFQQLPKTSASLEGSFAEASTSIKWRFGGAAAFGLGLLVVQLLALYLLSGKVVQVYLVANPPIQSVGQIAIHYRRPSHEAPATGINPSLVIRDLPYWSTELLVDRVECFGYKTAKELSGDLPPWKYPIDQGSVNIQMVRIDPTEDPFPDAADVRKLMEREGIAEIRARNRGKFTKDQVSLIIENQTDRPITIVAYDCVAALEKKPNLGGWFQLKDERDIEPGEKRPWGNFSKFEQPSGWFAVFVRYEDAGSNRVVQTPLGCYNLFNVRDPKLVVTRSGDGGIGFRMDIQQSKLGASR